MPALSELFAAAQAERASRIDFTLPAHVPDAEIRRLLTEGLPLMQGIQQRIVRSRGCETRVTAFLCCREGVLLVDEWRQTGRIPPVMADTLEIAARIPTQSTRARFLCGRVARHIRYANTAPGRVGYDRLVGAMGALTGGRANCQGFADAYYLIGTLAGLEVRHILGERNHRPHMWNQVKVGDEWLHVDVSRVSRLLAVGEDAADFILCPNEDFRAMGFQWRES